jgi:hypothetical protein
MRGRSLARARLAIDALTVGCAAWYDRRAAVNSLALSFSDRAGAGSAAVTRSVWLVIVLAVVALAAVIGAVWGLRRRARRPRALPLICPTCRRGYPAGTLFCALDAQRLVPEAEGAAAVAPSGARCPRCRRVFAAAVRFCPVDAEELIPLGRYGADPEAHGHAHDHLTDHLLGGEGKICPVCAARYDLEATFCGNDGSELVTVN